jgi:hypothetical protein
MDDKGKVTFEFPPREGEDESKQAVELTLRSPWLAWHPIDVGTH